MAFSLRKYDHVLLDMNGTFLFGFDRFGIEEKFGETYNCLGYNRLSPVQAQAYVRAAYDYLAVRYIDECYYEHFPSVREAIDATSNAVQTKGGFANEALSTELVEELVLTFSQHELGWLDNDHEMALRALRELRPMSVLSNLWAPKGPWIAQMKEWKILTLFDHLFFSSDGKPMKPHFAFFTRALQKLELEAAEILYVGDSYRCDVMGAAGVEMDVVYLKKDYKMSHEHPSQLVGVFKDFPSFVDACRLD